MSRIAFRPFSAFLIALTANSALAQDPTGVPPTAEITEAGVDAGVDQGPPVEPSPAAKTARAEFDSFLAQYQSLDEQIAAIKKDRNSKRGAEREPLEAQLRELRGEADAVMRNLAAAGAAVYEADPQAYPRVNQTVMAIAQFYLTGDARGNGGDQYEKALPVIEEMLDAGAGDEFRDLYLWGAVAATATNQFDKAKEYFAAAEQADLLSSGPPARSPRDPRNRIWEQAKNFHDSLDGLAKAWEKEKEIRAAEAEADDLPRVKFTTSSGDILVELFENEAPIATANMISLVKKGFYDGVAFHRVLPGFMAQGGDPTGTGSGGPGYNIRCECFQPNKRRHFRGSLSMAHAGRDTGGSQFFLTFVPTPFLDGDPSPNNHTVFGRVIDGMDNAAAINRRDPQAAAPVKPDKIIKAEVIRDRGHDYSFEKLPDR